MQRLALAAIDIYKRYLSPLKGFSCAYRVHTGSCSCSTLGARAIRRYGILRGLGVLRERTFLCGVVYRRYGGQRTPRPPVQQRGDCDLGCDLPDCDLFSGKSGGKLCDFLNCCDCGSCDWWQRKQDVPLRSRRRGRRESRSTCPIASLRRPTVTHEVQSMPDPSVERSSAGKSPGPGWRHAAHRRQPGLGVPLSFSACLERWIREWPPRHP